jgi:ferrous iron transport protein B
VSSCHTTAQEPTLIPDATFVTVALAGQPNVGKSTVFNLLTGLNQHVGNWAGKTVEQRTGLCRHDGVQMAIVDLPGTYSLSANSQEELIAREYIITQRPGVVAAIVDAAIIERSLYLVAEIMALDVPLVVGLNMMDVARQEGIDIDPHVLQAALGVPVIPMTAASNQGVRELVQAMVDVGCGRVICTPDKPAIAADHEAVLEEIERIVQTTDTTRYPAQWVALKLLEGDAEVTRMIQERLSPLAWQKALDLLRRHEDAGLAIAGGRYEWIGRMTQAAVAQPRQGQVTVTERLDRVATHPVWGIATLAAMLAVIFGLTYMIGAPAQAWLEHVIVGGLARTLSGQLVAAPAWLSGLLINGVLGGAGMLLTFTPILVIFFSAMAILEDVGYMARAAYVMDRFMHPIGLHGKSFLPLFLGFGCNVPAIQGTRIIEEPRARLLTILLAPLVPCTARMAVVAFIAPLFFGAGAMLVSSGLIMLNVIVLGGLGVVLSRTMARGEPLAFIMELPLYHKPHLRSIAVLVWQRCLSFFQRAGSLILIMSVIIWALGWLPNGNLETSLLAAAGRLLSPLGAAMGLNWQAMVALLTSFVAKENAIATMGVLLGAGVDGGLARALPQLLTPAAAMAFLVVQVLFVPCIATVSAMRQETGSWRWTLFGVALTLGISLAAGIGTYQILRSLP